MKSKSFTNLPLISISTAVILITLLVSILISSDPQIMTQPGMSLGVTADLLIFIPVSWLLISRKTRIPNFTVIPVLILTIISASFIIPEGHQHELTLVKTFLLPVIELSFAGFIIYKASKTLSGISNNLHNDQDALSAIKVSCSNFVDSKKAAMILATEIAMFYYAFASWKPLKPGKFSFSAYKESGIISVLAGVLLILTVETIWVHTYLLTINDALAWIVFALSIYSGIQIFAHLKALRSRGHSIGPERLTLRYGLFSEVEISYENIEEVVFTSENPENSAEKKLALLGDLEPHNIMIRVKQPVTISRIYGLRSQAQTVYFQCDERDRFRSTLSEKTTEILKA